MYLFTLDGFADYDCFGRSFVSERISGSMNRVFYIILADHAPRQWESARCFQFRSWFGMTVIRRWMIAWYRTLVFSFSTIERYSLKIIYLSTDWWKVIAKTSRVDNSIPRALVQTSTSSHLLICNGSIGSRQDTLIGRLIMKNKWKDIWVWTHAP